MIEFYIPFLYTFKTRLLTPTARTAWIFTYVIPVLLTLYLLAGHIGANHVISLICIYLIYEIGYIVNDAELIKNEAHPTLRLNQQQIAFYEKNKFNIFASRISILFISLFATGLTYDLKFARHVFLSCIAIFIVYNFYNKTRSKYTIVMYGFLVYLRYFGVAIFYCNLYMALLMFFIYPFYAILEFCGKTKYNMPWAQRLVRNTDRNRFFYYLIIFLLFYLTLPPQSDIFFLVILTGYFLAYRMLSFIFLSNGYRKK